MLSAKYLYQIGLLLLVFGGTAGCTKFLEIKPKGKEIAESVDDYNGLFNNASLLTWTAYQTDPGGLPSMLGNIASNILMGDDIYSALPYYNNMTPENKNAYQWNANILLPADNPIEWSCFYGNNYVYNVIANGVMNASDGTVERKKQLLAEARVNRAYMLFWLLQFYARPYDPQTAANDPGIPLVTKPDATANNYQRASVKECYDFITAELAASVDSLPATTISRVRMARAAGYFIQGQVYFYMKEYDKSLAALTQAASYTANSSIPIDLYDYNVLMPAWVNASAPYRGAGLYPSNFFSEETIFVNQSTALVSFVFSNYVYVKPEVLSLYNASDLRLNHFSNKDYFTGLTTLPGYRRVSPLVLNIGPSVPNLMLMQAECYARTGNLAAAKTVLESLREKRMPAGDAAVPVTSQEDLIKFCVDERQREYSCTGLRWFDTRRLFNDPLFAPLNATHPVDSDTYQLTQERLVLRIPPTILTYNPGMQDNP